MQKYTLAQFHKDYPNDDVCLERIFKPELCSCGRNKWYRVKGRPAYACACGKQINPLVGTIFQNSSTPLTTWFYVMYLMSQTKSGVSAAFIQRVTGVTYKCAWRMMHKIREQMQVEGQFKDEVEIDETFFKAKPWRNTRVSKGRKEFFKAPIVLGVVERSTGRVKTKILPAMRAWYIRDILVEHIVPGGTVYSDGSQSYYLIKRHFSHKPRIHWDISTPGENSFIPGEGTQKIENFWSQLKRGVFGVYRSVSRQHLQKYADEYAFRYSHRHSGTPMFELLLGRITKAN